MAAEIPIPGEIRTIGTGYLRRESAGVPFHEELVPLPFPPAQYSSKVFVMKMRRFVMILR
jgi:hypothetical protein